MKKTTKKRSPRAPHPVELEPFELRALDSSPLESVGHQPDWWIEERINWLEHELDCRRERRREAELAAQTIQDIQLELIRRSSFNDFDGPRVVSDLEEHRSLWTAALIDRESGPELSGLIKLRDLPGDAWNVDTLYVLARDEGAAQQLAELGELWRADRVEVMGGDATTRALGSGRSDAPERIVSFWWD